MSTSTPAVEAAAEQVRSEAHDRLRRGRLVTAVVAVVLVALVGVVALLGGLGKRTDLLTPVAVGSPITTGPFVVTIDRASVQHITSSGQWKVVATGTARTTGTTSIDPNDGDLGFLFAKSTATQEVQPSDSIVLGSTEPLLSLEHLTPGLPPVPWAVTFLFTRRPGDTLFLAVFDQRYTKAYIFGDELGWQATSTAETMTMPLEQQPDQEF